MPGGRVADGDIERFGNEDLQALAHKLMLIGCRPDRQRPAWTPADNGNTEEFNPPGQPVLGAACHEVAERFPGERSELVHHLGLSERTLYRKLAELREE